MTYRKYPDEKTVNEYIAKKEPLIFAISFDGETVLMSRLDDSFEHQDWDRFRLIVLHK